MNRAVVYFFTVLIVLNVAPGIRAEESTTQFGGNYAQIAETILGEMK